MWRRPVRERTGSPRTVARCHPLFGILSYLTYRPGGVRASKTGALPEEHCHVHAMVDIAGVEVRAGGLVVQRRVEQDRPVLAIGNVESRSSIVFEGLAQIVAVCLVRAQVTARGQALTVDGEATAVGSVARLVYRQPEIQADGGRRRRASRSCRPG